MMRSPSLFDERHFAWPEQKGDAEREAKLPWFWFTDVGEARLYLTLWWIWQGLAFLGFTNLLFVHNRTAGWILWPSIVVAQIMFMRVWIPLCRRADPNHSRWLWFTGGWFNPRARHCLLLARDHVYEAAGRDVKRR